jgi:hypothetical protein
LTAFDILTIGAIQIHLRHVGGEHHLRMVVVSRLRADDSPQTKVDQTSSHETQRVPEGIRRKIIDWLAVLLIQRRVSIHIDVNIDGLAFFLFPFF